MKVRCVGAVEAQDLIFVPLNLSVQLLLERRREEPAGPNGRNPIFVLLPFPSLQGYEMEYLSPTLNYSKTPAVRRVPIDRFCCLT